MKIKEFKVANTAKTYKLNNFCRGCRLWCPYNFYKNQKTKKMVVAELKNTNSALSYELLKIGEKHEKKELFCTFE